MKRNENKTKTFTIHAPRITIGFATLSGDGMGGLFSLGIKQRGLTGDARAFIVGGLALVLQQFVPGQSVAIASETDLQRMAGRLTASPYTYKSEHCFHSIDFPGKPDERPGVLPSSVTVAFTADSSVLLGASCLKVAVPSMDQVRNMAFHNLAGPDGDKPELETRGDTIIGRHTRVIEGRKTTMHGVYSKNGFQTIGVQIIEDTIDGRKLADTFLKQSDKFGAEAVISSDQRNDARRATEQPSSSGHLHQNSICPYPVSFPKKFMEKPGLDADMAFASVRVTPGVTLGVTCTLYPDGDTDLPLIMEAAKIFLSIPEGQELKPKMHFNSITAQSTSTIKDGNTLINHGIFTRASAQILSASFKDDTPEARQVAEAFLAQAKNFGIGPMSEAHLSRTGLSQVPSE